MNHAVHLSPGNTEILNHRGRLLLFLEDFDSAQVDFNEVLKINPDCTLAHSGLARSYWEQGNGDLAETFAKRAQAIDPANAEAIEVLSAVRIMVEAKSAAARAAIEQFYAKAHDDFAEVEPPELSDMHLKNSRVVSSRENILRLMPKGGICAEVGTQIGNFAQKIMTILEPAKLHIFDIDFTPFDHARFQSAIQTGIVELHQGDSSVLLADWPDCSFDFIYIDGNHSYDGVVKDLTQAAQKIKDDGWIVCNDYTIYSPLEQAKYGVYRAVNEFCFEHGFEIVYLGLHPWSYHDVALRKMCSADNNIHS
ncbi:MAG TPA: class I SAM-dependent methyltransferase [Candidatus Paceibacterota bacterium]|nr:class I SAM-dependent methyltransferase [Candidatus Paceibacterota bacterium]